MLTRQHYPSVLLVLLPGDKLFGSRVWVWLGEEAVYSPDYLVYRWYIRPE